MLVSPEQHHANLLNLEAEHFLLIQYRVRRSKVYSLRRDTEVSRNLHHGSNHCASASIKLVFFGLGLEKGLVEFFL